MHVKTAEPILFKYFVRTLMTPGRFKRKVKIKKMASKIKIFKIHKKKFNPQNLFLLLIHNLRGEHAAVKI